jgi:hypothetical protein
MTALRQHEESIHYPDSFFLRNGNTGCYRVTRERLEPYLQTLPERVQQVFRQKIAQNQPLNAYGFHAGMRQRDYIYLGQRWKFHYYEMGPPFAENVIGWGTISDTTSPLYTFCATDVEIEQIPVEIDPATQVSAPIESKGCMDYLMDLFRAISEFVKNCFACLCGYSQPSTVQ